MSENLLSPGVYRARSVARTSDNGDRWERPPIGKYRFPYLMAVARRALQQQREARRQAIQRDQVRAREIQAMVLRSIVERPTYSGWADVASRRNSLSAQKSWGWAGLTTRFTRMRAKERSEVPLLRNFNAAPGAYYKRVGARLLFVVATDVPIIAALPTLRNVGSALTRRMCPCGQHVFEYGVCANFWRRLLMHNLEHLEYLVTRGFVNREGAGIYFEVFEIVRETLYRAERGRSLIKTTFRKTVFNSVPVIRQIKMAAAIASDAWYVLSGSSLGVNASLQVLDKFRLYDITQNDLNMWGMFLAECGPLIEVGDHWWEMLRCLTEALFGPKVDSSIVMSHAKVADFWSLADLFPKMNAGIWKR